MTSVVEQRFGFDVALTKLEEGKRLQRVGWQNLGEFIFLVTPASEKVIAGDYLSTAFKEGAKIEMNPFIIRSLPPNKYMPWNATHTDLLSKNWRVS